jgi:hypothetical protein
MYPYHMELSLCVLSVVIIGQAHTANIIMYNITILISVYIAKDRMTENAYFSISSHHGISRYDFRKHSLAWKNSSVK